MIFVCVDYHEVPSVSKWIIVLVPVIAIGFPRIQGWYANKLNMSKT